jgi:hypothetical protein
VLIKIQGLQDNTGPGQTVGTMVPFLFFFCGIRPVLSGCHRHHGRGQHVRGSDPPDDETEDETRQNVVSDLERTLELPGDIIFVYNAGEVSIEA